MVTAKGQGPTACSALPRKSQHPAWLAGGVGNQVFKNSLDPHWSWPPLCEIGQNPGEITFFPTQHPPEILEPTQALPEIPMLGIGVATARTLLGWPKARQSVNVSG